MPDTRQILCLKEESFTGAHENGPSSGPAISSCDFSSKPPSRPETLPRNREQKSVRLQILSPVWKRAILLLWHMWGMCQNVVPDPIAPPPCFSNTSMSSSLGHVNKHVSSEQMRHKSTAIQGFYLPLCPRSGHQLKFGSTQGSRVTCLLASGHEDGPSTAAAQSICVYNSPCCC